MLSDRAFLLTATGLLTGFAATAQTAAPAATGPQPVDILSWVTWAAAAIVLLMALVTGASVTSAAPRRYAETTAPAPATTAAAPALTAETTPARPVPAQPLAAEALAA